MTAADRSSEELWVCHLGLVPYLDALGIQERVRARRHAGELPDTLLLLEHPPVYTRGRRAAADRSSVRRGLLPRQRHRRARHRPRRADHLSRPRPARRLSDHGHRRHRGLPAHDGGRHCRRARRGRRRVARAARGRARLHGRVGGYPQGTGERKIASIGVHVSCGVTTHGFAVNVHNDLEPFSWVVACGLPDVSMTSIARELDARAPAPERFRQRMAHSFCRAHDRRQRPVSPRRLGIDTANAARRAATRAPIHPSQPPPVDPPAPVEGVPA